MELFFDLAYALVIFGAFLVVGWVPGVLFGLLVPTRDKRLLLLPAYSLALAGWIWFGWTGGRYGISRLGLVLFCAVAAVGFVRGAVLGVEAGRRARAAAARSRGAAKAPARRPRTPASPR